MVDVTLNIHSIPAAKDVWRTPLGERTLIGAEAVLLRELLGYVYDQIDVIHCDPGAPYRVGVRQFDLLYKPQQLAILWEIGAALLSSEVPALELTSVREASVYGLFTELRISIEVEIDCEAYRDHSIPSWRELLLAVFLEDGISASELPSPCCIELSEWDDLVGAAADRILWDTDWEMEELFVDETPEKSTYLRQMMHISDGYFLGVAPDPEDEVLARVRRHLNELTGSNH